MGEKDGMAEIERERENGWGGPSLLLVSDKSTEMGLPRDYPTREYSLSQKKAPTPLS